MKEVKWWHEYPDTVIKRFRKFHSDNPQVWKKFKELSLEMKDSGKTSYSARTIIEVMRWEHDLRSNESGTNFKINGDFVPIYARLVSHKCPGFEGFFQLRKIRSKGVYSNEEMSRRAK